MFRIPKILVEKKQKNTRILHFVRRTNRETKENQRDKKDKILLLLFVKGFLQVYEDTTGKVAIVNSISCHFCEAYKSMIGWIITSKTKLIGKQYFIFSEKAS